MEEPNRLVIEGEKLNFTQLVARIIEHYRGGPVKNLILKNCVISSIPKSVTFSHRIKIDGRWHEFFLGLYLEKDCIITGNQFEEGTARLPPPKGA